jgi:O-antigen/teichoic acid export membrane protein
MRFLQKVVLAKSKLLRGSVIVLVGALGGSFFNYLFHLVMGRMLSPADYGILVALLSLLYLISVPGSVLMAGGTKFASKYKSSNNTSAVSSSLLWLLKWVGYLGLFLLALSVLVRSYLADFLNIPEPTILVLFFVYSLFSLLASAPRGYLRGLLRFKSFSLVSFFGPVVKLLLGVLLISVGWGIWGAVGALVISSFLVLVMSLGFLSEFLRLDSLDDSFQPQELVKYLAPTVIFLLALTSYYTADVILVKHFFSPLDAGIYSSAATLGRIIYFALNSVITVMFPLVSDKYENGQSFVKTFGTSLTLVVIGASVGSLAYFVLPTFLVGTFFGSLYLSAVPILGWFGLFMALYSVVALFAQLFLSVHDFSVGPILFGLAVLQAGLVWFFHSSLSQVLFVNIGVMILALAVLAFQYRRKYLFLENGPVFESQSVNKQ